MTVEAIARRLQASLIHLNAFQAVGSETYLISLWIMSATLVRRSAPRPY
jgi:hypothetical protein